MADQLALWPEEGLGGKLSWSVTRDKRLQTCRRKYFLQHYGSRGGSRPDAAPRVREIYVLKHLRTRQMWVGEVVHEMIEMALNHWRRGTAVPVEAVVERGTRRMRAQYAESIQGIYRDQPRTACGLVEHEYREAVSREEWQHQRDRMERCLRSFYELPILATIRQTPPWQWLALESMSTFELDGATVIVKPDLAWRDEATGDVVMADWKTGQRRPKDDRFQLAAYGLFAQRVWGLPRDRLQAHLAYLDVGEVDTLELTGEALSRVEQQILSSLSVMRDLAARGREGDLDPEAFPRSDDLAVCRWCNFRRVCERD